MKIGLFDSGVGGLFVLKEMLDIFPNNEYIYFGDTKNLPYGEKSKDELKEYSSKIIKFLFEKKVDIIIIACGTISTNIYNDIKNNYDIKIYDIVSPTIKYINSSKYKKIGIIGTKKTIESNFFENNIEKETISLACPNLVQLIENKEDDKIKEYIKENFKIFKNVDSLILGCTHYPYMEENINKLLKINTVNMGKVLINNLKISNSKKFKLDLYFSKITPSLKKNVNDILKNNYKIKEKVL